jgi:hypothetical protein
MKIGTADKIRKFVNTRDSVILFTFGIQYRYMFNTIRVSYGIYRYWRSWENRSIIAFYGYYCFQWFGSGSIYARIRIFLSDPEQ